MSAKAKTVFLQDTFAQLGYFVKHEVTITEPGGEDASGSASQSPVQRKEMEFGARALSLKWAELTKKKAPEQMSLKDLEIFGCFRHLLSGDKQKSLDAFVKAAYAKSPAAKAKPPARKAKAKPSPAAQQSEKSRLQLAGLVTSRMTVRPQNSHDTMTVSHNIDGSIEKKKKGLSSPRKLAP